MCFAIGLQVAFLVACVADRVLVWLHKIRLLTSNSQMLSNLIYSTITRNNICVARTKISIILSRGQNKRPTQMLCTYSYKHTMCVSFMKYC